MKDGDVWRILALFGVSALLLYTGRKMSKQEEVTNVIHIHDHYGF